VAKCFFASLWPKPKDAAVAACREKRFVVEVFWHPEAKAASAFVRSGYYPSRPVACAASFFANPARLSASAVFHKERIPPSGWFMPFSAFLIATRLAIIIKNKYTR